MGNCFGRSNSLNDAKRHTQEKPSVDFDEAEKSLGAELDRLKEHAAALKVEYHSKLVDYRSADNAQIALVDLQSVKIQIEATQRRYAMIRRCLDKTIHERSVLHHTTITGSMEHLRALAIGSAKIPTVDMEALRDKSDDRMEEIQEIAEIVQPLPDGSETVINEEVMKDLQKIEAQQKEEKEKEVMENLQKMAARHARQEEERNDTASEDEIDEDQIARLQQLNRQRKTKIKSPAAYHIQTQ